MSLASYQGWEVGAKRVSWTGPNVYHSVMDGGPYRWQQQQHQLRNHHQADSMKGNISTSSLSLYKQQRSNTNSNWLSPGEPTNNWCVAEPTSMPRSSSPHHGTILRGQEERGPVTPYVLPCLSRHPGSEQTSFLGGELEVPKTSLIASSADCVGWRDGIRNGPTLEVRSPEHDDGDFHSCDQEVPEVVRPTGGLLKVVAQDCREVLSTLSPPALLRACEGPALSTSSSSIGVGGEHSLSDYESDDNTGDEEVQSARRKAPLSSLAALEDSLPIK
jgi:hypothetical protein